MMVTLAANKWSGERQRRSKLQVVTVGYCSGGLMKEEIITFTISYGRPNDSRRISHQTQRQFSTGCYIVFFTDIFQLIVERTVPCLLVILLHHRE